MTRDALGNPASGNPEAVRHLDDAVDRSLGHDGGVVAAVRAAIRADPTFGLPHALLALTDPSADATESLDRAVLLVQHGSDRERSLVGFLDSLIRSGMWAAEQAGLDHARAHPRDLLGVGLAATVVERSARPDVHEAVLAVYAPSVRALGAHPFLQCMTGFVAQEQGHFDEAERLATQALQAEPASVTAAHLRAHVYVETGEHDVSLDWLDGFRHRMDPSGDYVHHMAWHAALHALARGDVADVLRRLGELSGPGCDPLRQVVDNGTLLMRCRLCGVLAPGEDPTHGLAGAVPDSWLVDLPSMYVAFHAAVGLAVQGRHDELVALASRAAQMPAPGLAELLVPLSSALADYVAGRFGQAVARLLALRPTMYRWGGSRAQREVVEDILVDAAVRGARPDIAALVLTERTDRRPNRWDAASLRAVSAR